MAGQTEKTNQESELLKISETLGNYKLDAAELRFLWSQEKLLLDVKVTNVKLLLNDIHSANSEQLKKDTRMNELLEGYVMKENLDDLANSIAKKAGLNDGGKKLKSRLSTLFDVRKSKDDKKLIVIKLLLDAYYKKIDAKYELKHPFTSWSEFVVLLHRFQKETNAGIASRSAVDCIVGRRTIQQLLAYQWLSVLQWAVEIDKDFTKLHEAKTKKIRTSAEAQKVIQLIMGDESLTEEERFTAALEIYKNAHESGTDANGKKIENSNPQYSAAVIIMGYAKKLLPALDENTRKNIKSMLTESGISKDWNAKNSNTYVKKSDDLFLEVDQKIEKAKEKTQRIDMMLQFGDAWINYYQQKASNAREAGVSELYPQWVKEMEALKTYEWSDRNQRFSNAFDKMFFTTEARQDYSSLTVPSQCVYPWYWLLKSVWIDWYENHNHQVNFFYDLRGFVVNPAGARASWYDRNTEQWRRKMIEYFMSGMREIDKDYDATISRAEWYQSWNAVDKITDSSVWTDQSLINLRIENDEDWFNKGMWKIDEFFTGLKKTPPLKESVQILNELVSALDFGENDIFSGSPKKTKKIAMPQKDWTYIESEMPVLEYDKHQVEINYENNRTRSNLLYQKVRKYFWIDLTEEIIERMKGSFSEAKQAAVKMEIDMMSTAKKEYENQKKEIKEDIMYYTNLIAEYPNDAKVSERTSLKKWLEAMVDTINPDAVTEDMEFGKDKDGNPVTIKAIIEDQKRSLYAKSFEVGLAWWVMESNKKSINGLRDKDNKSSDEQILSHFASVHGVGKYTADATINMYQAIAKELIIQIVICFISMWIGNLVAKSVLSATKWALNASKSARLNALAARMWEYSMLAKGWLIPVFTKTVSTSTKIWTLVTWTVELVIEWTTFHISSTVLNNIYAWAEWTNGLGDTRWYIQSIAFLWVLKEVSSIMSWSLLKNGQCTTEQITLLKQLESGKSLTASEVSLLPRQLPKGMKYSPNQIKALSNSKISLPQLASKTESNLMVAKNTRVVNNLESWFIDAEVISSRLLSKQAYKINFNMSKLGNLVKWMGVEMWSLMVTDQVISLLFDQKFKEISMKDMVSMLGMIIGLRALRKIDPLHKINEKLDEFMIKDVVRNGKWEIVDLVLYDGKTQTMWSEMKKNANEANTQQGKSKEQTKKETINRNGPSKKTSQEAPKKEEVKVEKEENAYDNLTAEEVKNKIQDINDQINKIEQWGWDINWDKFGNASIETIKNEITICEKNITNPKIQERLIVLKNSLQLREAELAKLKWEMTELMKAKNAPKAESTKNKTSEDYFPWGEKNNLQEWKIEKNPWEPLEKTTQRAMEKAKEMWKEYAVVVQYNAKISEVYVVKQNTDFKLSVEMRFQDGVVENGPRKNGKLEGENCKKTYENTETWEKNISEGIFRDWELRSGKITNTKWEVIKEMYQGQEIFESEISFEELNSLDEVYTQLDKVWSIYSKDAKKTYTAKEIKEMIRKWETKYIPSEWGLRSKVESLQSDVFSIENISWAEGFNKIKTEIINSKELYEVWIEWKSIPKWDIVKRFIDAWFVPQNTIKIGNEVLYTTNQISYKSRNYILWYTSKGEVRMFYRSWSEWVRRSAPWGRYDWNLSKWEFIKNGSYETTTRVDPRIGEIMDSYKIESMEKSPVVVSKEILESYNMGVIEFNMPQMKKEIEYVDKMFPDKWNDAVDFYKRKSYQDVINDYNTLTPKWLDYTNMQIVRWKEYSYTHEYLGEVNITVCRTKWNGIDVDIHFAKAKGNHPDQVWIENIIYSDAKINSFGVYDKQINAWPLTAKPLDYINQTPSDLYPRKGLFRDPDYAYGLEKIGHQEYLDIRILYQWNPVIKYAKEHVLGKIYANN